MEKNNIKNIERTLKRLRLVLMCVKEPVDKILIKKVYANQKKILKKLKSDINII